MGDEMSIEFELYELIAMWFSSVVFISGVVFLAATRPVRRKGLNPAVEAMCGTLPQEGQPFSETKRNRWLSQMRAILSVMHQDV